MASSSSSGEYADVPPEILEFMSEDEEEESVEEEAFVMDWGSVIVVDNLPKIPMAKYEKLLVVLKRIFVQTGNIVRLEMPSEEEKTLGIAFVEFSTVEEATKALRLTDGYTLDKSHAFKVNAYSILDMVSKLPETWVAGRKPDFQARLNPHSWLSDGRDQLAVRYNNETEVRWAERNAAPSLEYGGEREKQGGLYWCEMYVQWSPQGSLLATFHNKGIALWGDARFSKQGRFAHSGVKHLDFSPCENYMITTAEDKRGCVVWDVRLRREIRSFDLVKLAPHAPPQVATPLSEAAPSPSPTASQQAAAAAAAATKIARFQWSYDDSYCARRAKDKSGNTIISIYELPSMMLLDKKSLKADGVVDFQWSPAANKLAYWAPEQGNTPARVTIVEIPSRRELRQKNLVKVSDCTLYWHPDGQYLCVKVLRHTKSKKTTFTSLELFRVNEALVPVEMLEMKSNVVALAWEPGGHRFAVVDGERIVSFYSMADKAEVKLVFALENRQCNALYWSPMGGYIVLAGIGDGLEGILEFYDVDNKWGKQVEHYRATQVAWDPSGRIVATSVVQPLEGAFFKFQMDNGYKLWTFQGHLFHDSSYENMYQLTWRPRPKSLLDAAQKKTIVKNLRKYERKFAHDDKMKDMDRQRELTTEKRAARRAYRDLLARRKQAYFDSEGVRTRMRNGIDADSDDFYVVTTNHKEILLSSKDEIC
ncbi:hypothetical protein CTAYLR_007168 [Chrysophaeum taylorii]|uniref:Eukaryotic translation initiation factor 3 subunit B n=1 Tax=Chrysophaeum taylorii TaxID=2483200 RepID=A0AAD7UMC5_9STRA|nr:hypothetical protein CTAYLR_007168 [Chrysophaeum taylorii]